MLSDGTFASCSGDSIIKIFNLKNYDCEKIIEGHTNRVNYLCQLENAKVISCSDDQIIKIWNISYFTYKCEYTLEQAHEDSINKIISLSNNRFASCSADTKIKIWKDNHPYSLIAELNGHTDNVVSILQIKNKELLISLSDDDTL